MNNKRNDIKYFRECLRNGGYKLTDQRLHIIDVIYEENRHMNAEEIYKEVQNNKVGLSTVYRNLMILEEVGVLKKINISNSSYYELHKFNEDRIDIHAKCIKCNKIIDIDEAETSIVFDDLIKSLNIKHSIKIISSSVILSGVCNDCEKKYKLKKVLKDGNKNTKKNNSRCNVFE